MNRSEKIVETISMLKLLNENGIDLVRNAINSCLTVQALQDAGGVAYLDNIGKNIAKTNNITNKM